MPVRATATPINPSDDTWVTQFSPTTNYGAATLLHIGLISGKASDDRRALLEFDLSGFSDSHELITKAELSVYATGAVPFGMSDMYVRRINRDFDPATANWNTYDGSNNWTSLGGDYDASTDYPISPGTGENRVDITPLVLEALKAGSPLRLVIMVDANPTSSSWTIRSLDHGTASERPSIEIEYAPKGRRLKRTAIGA